MRQRLYLKALETLPNVVIHFGRFSANQVRMALVDQNAGRPKTALVWKTEEKGSDVNIATHLLLDGHDHLYERFGPQDPDGRSDPLKGITEFVAGTGGASLYAFGAARPNSQMRLSAYGVLELTLTAAAYEWKFIQAVNEFTRDAGASACH